MRTLSFSVAAMVAAGLAIAVAAQEVKPLNAKCPVKGEPAKADITIDVGKGKVIGFC